MKQQINKTSAEKKAKIILKIKRVDNKEENYLIESLENPKIRETVFFRWKVINFHQKYGTKRTIEAFKISKATIYRWKKLWKEGSCRLEALIPKNKFFNRKKKWYPEIIDFILNFKKRYPDAGKRTVKLVCDKFCREKNLEPLSASTIGRIIKYLKEKINS